MKKLQSRVLFQLNDDRLIGFIHINERKYVFGVHESDERPKTPVFVADAFKDEIEPGRIYLVDLVLAKNKKCYIAYNPNPEICTGSVEMEDEIISVKIGKSVLQWSKKRPKNAPGKFLTYVTNRKELRNKAEIFDQVVACFEALCVDYTA